MLVLSIVMLCSVAALALVWLAIALRQIEQLKADKARLIRWHKRALVRLEEYDTRKASLRLIQGGRP
jgi:hypothetical protein